MRVLLFCFLFMLFGCTDAPGAKRVLEQNGYKDVQITGYNWFACSKDDTYHTGFVASRDGQSIAGTVCSGLFFKNYTIRFE